MKTHRCYHCHLTFHSAPHFQDEKPFCCRGCKMVYLLIQQHELGTFYDLVSKGGNKPNETRAGYSELDEELFKKKLSPIKMEMTCNLFLPFLLCIAVLAFGF